MIIIGLTGGIGMGKSTVAKILSGFGFPVHSADQAVHDMLETNGKAVRKVAKVFPEALRGDAINRKLLGQLVFHDQTRLKKLENILHPLVLQAERAFLREAKRAKAPAAILEIPLLFETKAEARCDIILCVTAPKAVQKARVMRRSGMTAAKFKAITARQMPDAEKRRRADYVIPTGTRYAATQKHLRVIMNKILKG